MPLRCLLFSSNEEMVRPIWQVLADLGIEGEYCRSAVDAVEKVTTQLFQIAITDWDDQPEAAFLLKTTRDLRAAQRPLTLAIVSDDARLPEALRAGANSVLVKPIRVEQVRDAMSTACELLRAKQPFAVRPPATIAGQAKAPATAVVAATAAAAAVPVSAPAVVTQAPEKAFRAGEFLQTPSSTPGAQFDTESEVLRSLDQAAAAEVEALTELEPTASAVAADPAAEPIQPQVVVTGWASLQARLTRAEPQKPAEPSTKSELLSYGETPSFGAPAASSAEDKNPEASEWQGETGPEAALFAYMSGESAQEAEWAGAPRPRRSKLVLVGILAAACVAVVAVPRTRHSVQTAYRKATTAGRNWLNPQPVPVPQAAAQHETFGQDGVEYKLPVTGNIPDVTTDPSQIRVLPVIDPTAKPVKASEANGPPATAGDSAPTDRGQGVSGDSAQPQVPETPVKEQALTSGGNAAANAGTGSPIAIASSPQPQPREPVEHRTSPRVESPSMALPEQSPPPSRVTPPASAGGIPSSLRTQTASMVPEASGAKPVEAAMSSIEPVSLPELVAWDLLAQKVDPVYPDSAKASGQRGSVVLQVLIGRDGVVQDAKFLQGSLVFARAAIEAVKQWRFKPYSMNGRAVSVQSAITLNFKPPA